MCNAASSAASSESAKTARRAFSRPARRRISARVASPEEDRLSGASRRPDALGGEVNHPIGNRRGAQHPDEMATVEPETRHDHVSRAAPCRGSSMRSNDPPGQAKTSTERDGTRGREHGHHGDRHHHLVGEILDQAQPVTASGEDEGQLADLRERKAGGDPGSRRIAEDRQHQPDPNRLERHDAEREAGDRAEMLRCQLEVEEHPDRDEEEAVEDVPQRPGFGEDLVLDVGARDQDPARRAPSARENPSVRHERAPQADEERPQQQELADPRLGRGDRGRGAPETTDHRRPATVAASTPHAQHHGAEGAASDPESRGTTRSRGTIRRSWKTRIPVAARP